MGDDTVPMSLRTQRAGRVVATLDGDAHVHVWEPNRSDDRIDCDLTDHVALLIDLGLDAPPAPEPHWTDTAGSTVIVSLDAGARGHITVRGHPVSTEAGVRLAADGFLQMLRDALPSAHDEIAEAGADDSTDGDEGPDASDDPP